MGSGSTDWVRTRDQIITRALRIVGAVSMGDTPSSSAITEATEALNAIVKQLQTRGVRLWTQDWVNQYISNPDQISVSGTNYICVKSGSCGDDPYLPSAASLWRMYWIEGGESGDTADSTISYSPCQIFTPASNVLDIEKMFIRDDDTDYELDKITFKEYMGIPDKYPSSIPTKFAFEHSVGKVHLYPVPDDTTYVVYYLATTSLEDFDSSGDIPDFPVRYIEMLTWMLASRLASEKRLTVAERLYIDGNAEKYWREVMTDDNENVDTECVNNAY